MDKAYTMMYELDKYGLVAKESNLSQDDSDLAIERSLYLPRPNVTLEINTDNLFRFRNESGEIFSETEIDTETQIEFPNNLLNTPFEELLVKYNPQLFNSETGITSITTISQLNDWLNNLDGITKVSFYTDFLNILNNFANGKQLVWFNEYDGINTKGIIKEDKLYNIVNNVLISSEPPIIPQIILDINKHNTLRLRPRQLRASLRNKVMAGMRRVATDIHNLESAIQPMDMSPITDIIDDYESKYKPEVAKHKYDYISPTTKWMIQYENSVGKEDVGIAANAIKADGAIQLRYNMLFAQSGNDVNNLSLGLNLNLSYNGRRIYSKHFLKWANVKCTKEQFISLCFGVDFTQDYDYQILTGNRNFDQRIIESVISDWTLYKKEINPNADIKNINDYIDFLWFRTNFENNAADYLSIYISLATDNAKELALARLHASPDLMSMPLTMTALGMDLNAVVDVCINLLDVIAKDLEVNRFETGKLQVDIRLIIKDHTGLGKEFDQATGESLLKIYNAAQEMRTITSFFKVNLGITANYSDLLYWMDGLSKSKIERDKSLSDYERNLIRTNGLEKYIGLKIDFQKLLTNKDGYADEIQAYCELIKVGVNYIDIIRTSPHFKAQLDGVNFMTKLIENNSFVAKLSQLALRDAELDENTVDTPDSSESDTHIGEHLNASLDTQIDVNKNAKYGQIDASNAYRRMTQLGYHYAVGVALDRLALGKDQFGKTSTLGYRLLFKKSDIDSNFQNEANKNLGDNTIIDISTNKGIDYFIDVVEKQVIPYLKQTYPDNLFTRSLEKEKDWETGRTIYGCKYDVFGRAEDLSDADKLNQVMRQFSQIMRNDSKVRTIDGNGLSIGEIMYLYALITTKDRICALNTILRPVQEYSKLPKVLEDVNKSLDQIVQEESAKSIEEDVISANILRRFNLFDKLPIYKRALLSKDKVYGGLNLANGFVMTKIPIAETLTVKEFEDELKSKVNGNVNVKSTLDDGTIDFTITVDQNHTIDTFTFSYSNVGNSKENVRLDSANVLHMLDVVVLNTKSVFDMISELELSGIENVLQYGSLKENLLKILTSDRTISRLLDGISENNKTVVIKSGIDSNVVNRSFFTTYSTSNGDLTIIVLREDALTVNSSELIDLLLQLQIGNRRDDKLVTLIKTIYPDATVNRLTVDSYISELKNSPKNSEIFSYVLYLEDLEEDREYKNLCREELKSFENALLNPDLYYANTVSNDIKSGDRLVDSDGINYLCLGKKRGDKYTFILLTDIEESPKVYESKSNRIQGKELTKVAELKLFQNQLLSAPRTIKYNEYNSVTTTPIDNVVLDDLIVTENGDFVVVQIVFDGTDRLLIAYNPNIKTYQLFTGTVNSRRNVNNNKFGENHLDLTPSIISGNSAIKLSNAFNYLRANDIVISNGKKYNFYLRLTSNTILVKTGNDFLQLTIDDVDEIRFNRVHVLDKELKLISTPKILYGKYSEVVKNTNELFSGEESWKTDKEKHSWTLLNEDESVLRHFSNYSKITNPDYMLVENDIVVIKNGDTENVYKLISLSEDGSWIAYESNGDTFNALVLTDEFLKQDKIVYSKNSNSKRTNIKVSNPGEFDLSNMTDSELGNDIIEYLQDVFGVSVSIENNPDATLLAKISGNVLAINMAANNGSVTPGKYIAKCAIHEFTHLALANLQVHSPETYFALIEYVKNLADDEFDYSIWSQILNNDRAYPSDTDKYEEYIVRFIDKRANLDINSKNVIQQAINKGLSDLFKIDPKYFSELDRNISLGRLLKMVKTDFFGETVRTFNMNMILNESVALKEFDKIEMIC